MEEKEIWLYTHKFDNLDESKNSETQFTQIDARKNTRQPEQHLGSSILCINLMELMGAQRAGKILLGVSMVCVYYRFV